MKKIIIIFAFLMLATNALALQEVAGPLVMSVPIGGSNSSRYGLLNDGNETINVSITADNNTVKYLSFPSTVELQPKKLVYVNITASIPADYDKTGNITGFIYALQEGASGGQVQINVQMMKSVVISVYGQPKQTTSSGQTNQGTSSQSNEANSPSGLITMTSNNYSIVILVIVVIAIAFIIYKTKRKNVKKTI